METTPEIQSMLEDTAHLKYAELSALKDESQERVRLAENRLAEINSLVTAIRSAREVMPLYASEDAIATEVKALRERVDKLKEDPTYEGARTGQ